MQPLKVESLVLRKRKRRAVLLANLTGETQRVCVNGLTGTLAVKRLDETNAEKAMTQPEKFRAKAGETLQARQGGIEVDLKPYAVARVDSIPPMGAGKTGRSR